MITICEMFCSNRKKTYGFALRFVSHVSQFCQKLCVLKKNVRVCCGWFVEAKKKKRMFDFCDG